MLSLSTPRAAATLLTVALLTTSALAQINPLQETPGEREFSGRLIVKPSQRAAQSDTLMQLATSFVARERVAGQVVTYHREVDEYVVEVPAGMSDAEYAEQLAATGDYDYVAPDWIVYIVADPNDPSYSSQWHHGKIESSQAWDLHTGSGVTVAIVDTGVDSDHPDLAAALVPGFSLIAGDYQPESTVGEHSEDAHGHGTHVAGCAAAIGNNGVGVCGVGWGLNIMPVKVSASGSAYLSDITNAARQAAFLGAKVVNVSFSGVDHPSVDSAGTYIREQGGLLFWAAGNDGQLISGSDHEDVIVVSSTDALDNKASSSNYGELVDIAAPGISIWSTTRGGGYAAWSGTSMAAPVAAGVGAMIWSADPNLAPAEVEQALFDSCEDIGAAGEDIEFGHGRVNLHRALTDVVVIEYALGDMNCDGIVDTYDIDGFIAALTGPADYAAQEPTCDYWLADSNGDGLVDTYDIDSFVARLTSP